jgi:serine protease Do
MQYNDNGTGEYAGYGYMPQDTAENDRTPQYTQENNAAVTPAGAPAERTDAPVPEKMIYAPRKFYMYNREHVTVPRADEWREPIYSQTQEITSTMYTPGISVNQPYPLKRSQETEPERSPREHRFHPGAFIRAACLILVCAILSGVVTYGVMEYRINKGDFKAEVVNQVVLGGTVDTQQNSGLSAPVTVTGVGMSPEDIYTMACTQVVSITTESDIAGSIFGSTLPGSSTTVVAGSGFIISGDGYILTNYHVVETAYSNNLQLKVILNGGAEYEANVIGFDKNNDVALIKIDVNGLNPAIIANSDAINVGQTIYAVGNPFGELVYTMTEGIISARDRDVSVEGKMINTFQFSAAVNSGNSGGPVYNTNGEVIGIVTAKPMRSSVEGIGFAIPINDAIGIAVELIEYGYITGRPLMGITAQTVSGAHAEFYGWVVGAYVKSVNDGSAASIAGMATGDIIIGLGDAEIDSMETLVFTLRKFRAGDTTALKVWRSGEEIVLFITFDEDLSAGQANPPKKEIPAETTQPSIIYPPGSPSPTLRP